MSIVERPSGYGVRVREHGRRLWLGTFASRELAERAQQDWLMTRSNTATVAQWSRVWLVDYRRPSRSTQGTYASTVKRIVEDLGHLGLDDVDRPRARKLAQVWPRGTSRIARTMWADAVRDGLATRNPWTNLRLETPRGRKDLTALTEAQITELSTLARGLYGDYGGEMAAILLTLAYVGCRPGELCAVRRDDTDFTLGEMTIRYSVDSTGAEKTPKNGKPRVVMIPPPAIEGLLGVPSRLGSPYLFHSPTGKRLSKGALSYLWRPVRAAWVAQGHESLALYGLRHACATMLVQRGVPAYAVAQQLGHSDGGRLVQQLYAHPAESNARDLVRMAFNEPATVREEARSA